MSQAMIKAVKIRNKMVQGYRLKEALIPAILFLRLNLGSLCKMSPPIYQYSSIRARVNSNLITTSSKVKANALANFQFNIVLLSINVPVC
jgi:hypothetical protein